ncbi:hypothetical protein ACJMK2_024239 [Sinanodonta woodiana]|uniref:Peptidase M12B domain-containing protein n=1 Tax=Sinanodonta woodiana TaxID=1069815 RepID=A0ABD3T6S1_SINWO
MHETYDIIIRGQHGRRKYQVFRNDKQKYKERNSDIVENSFDLSKHGSGTYSKFPLNHGISQRNRMKAHSQQDIHKTLDPSLSTSPSMNRTARDSNSINATVEILVWTDYSFYKYFTALEPDNAHVDSDILRYVATLVNAADVRMKKGLSRDPSLKISIVLSGVVICKTSNCSWFIDDFKINNTIDNHVALDHFAETLQANYETNKLHFRYDFAVALTKLDLTDPNSVPIGVANADDICHLKEGESSAVIEDQGAFSSVGTLVHEMAHTLGSDHDGWFRSENCSSDDGYVMSTLSPLSPNGFYFSACSIKSIKENLM